MELYLKIMFGRSPLKRYQREMLGVVVSRSNACQYCITHHAEALSFYWKDNEKLTTFIGNFRNSELSETDRMLCEYAEELTLWPQAFSDDKWIQKLKNTGLDDRAILDATLVIGYFNFVNRIVQSLGVGLEADPGGYKY